MEREYDELVKQHKEELMNVASKQQRDAGELLVHHADTISMLEQRLDATVSQNKQHQQEIAVLKLTNAGQHLSRYL